MDIWSVGVILYEALYGRAPYASSSLEELVARIREERPVILPTNRQGSGSGSWREKFKETN